jgi:hypothetical protein
MPKEVMALWITDSCGRRNRIFEGFETHEGERLKKQQKTFLKGGCCHEDFQKIDVSHRHYFNDERRACLCSNLGGCNGTLFDDGRR